MYSAPSMLSSKNTVRSACSPQSGRPKALFSSPGRTPTPIGATSSPRSPKPTFALPTKSPVASRSSSSALSPTKCNRSSPVDSPQPLCKTCISSPPPSDDTWARDHAFLTVLSDNGAELLDFRFNGWGGKFAAARDNAINRRLFDTGWLHGHYVSALDFELEGGAIESDGAGTLLTTAACLLNPNRRLEGDAVPVPDRGQVELLLRERLGAERILWLHHGYLAGDDTDSHIDTLARLCPNHTIVYVKCDDPSDEHHAELQAMEAELEALRTADGRPYRLLALPMPDAIHDEAGERLPATYANFLIMNRAVLLPTYHQPEHDEAARKVLQRAFPQHEIVGVDCRSLIRQHGSLHCVTMQYPRGVVRFD